MLLIMTECQSIFITRYGSPDVLKFGPASIPEPAPGEVQINIKYVGINFADTMSRMGLYPTRLNPPYVPGMEIAGTVSAAGDNAPSTMIGQVVVGICTSGGYSNYVNVPAGQLFIIDPKWLDVAAAIPVNYLTAYFMMIHQGNLRENETILIHGIGGGVGIAALQIAKRIGARIIGTASGMKHKQLRDFGIEDLIDYRTEDFRKRVLEITENRGVDLVLDSLGGKALASSYACLSEFGRVAVYGFSSAAKGLRRNYLKILPEYFGMPNFKPTNLMMKNKGAFGFHLGMIRHRKDLIRDYGNILFQWLEEGTISPVIDTVFTLEKAAAAHRYIADRKNFGKVLLSPES